MASSSFFRALSQLSALLPTFLLVIIVIIPRTKVTVKAHFAIITNTLNDSLATHCYDPEADPALPVASKIDFGQNVTVSIEDLSMSRACAFSWLGTARVKDLVVWQRDTCDACFWQVDDKGFSRRQDDGTYKLIFSWRTSCFYDSAY